MKLAIFIAVVLITGLAFTAADTQAQVKPGRVMNAAAQTAADSWMNLIDDGNYARAWEVSSDLFKSRISQEYWRGLMAGRAAYGMVGDRMMTLSTIGRLPSFPNAPYYVVRYAVGFMGATSLETVALRDENGTWRIVAYDRAPLLQLTTRGMIPLSN